MPLIQLGLTPILIDCDLSNLNISSKLFIDFLKLITPGEYGIFSHIGGYLVGIFYYFSLYGLPSLKARRKPRYNNRRKYSPTKQIKVDKILDKISKSGYDSLNKEEKEFLFKQGGKK